LTGVVKRRERRLKVEGIRDQAAEGKGRGLANREKRKERTVTFF
jgi:hypothetical protein